MVRKSAEAGKIARGSWKREQKGLSTVAETLQQELERGGNGVEALIEDVIRPKGETARLSRNVEPMEPGFGHSREGRLCMNDAVGESRDELHVMSVGHRVINNETVTEEGSRLPEAQFPVIMLQTEDRCARGRVTCTSDNEHYDADDSRPTAEDIISLRMHYGYMGGQGGTELQIPSSESRSQTM